MIEHNGCFVILEFKGFHNDKINLPIGQMIAYEQLHEKLNRTTKCYVYSIGCGDIDFSNPDASVWLFEMNQWKNNSIPHIIKDIYGNDLDTKKVHCVQGVYGGDKGGQITILQHCLLVKVNIQIFSRLPVA